LERYNIQKISKNNLQLNDAVIDLHNPIFEALNKIYMEDTVPTKATHSKHRLAALRKQHGPNIAQNAPGGSTDQHNQDGDKTKRAQAQDIRRNT
jgi:hypothetical protein